MRLIILLILLLIILSWSSPRRRSPSLVAFTRFWTMLTIWTNNIQSFACCYATLFFFLNLFIVNSFSYLCFSSAFCGWEKSLPGRVRPPGHCCLLLRLYIQPSTCRGNSVLKNYQNKERKRAVTPKFFHNINKGRQAGNQSI